MSRLEAFFIAGILLLLGTAQVSYSIYDRRVQAERSENVAMLCTIIERRLGERCPLTIDQQQLSPVATVD